MKIYYAKRLNYPSYVNFKLGNFRELIPEIKWTTYSSKDNNFRVSIDNDSFLIFRHYNNQYNY